MRVLGAFNGLGALIWTSLKLVKMMHSLLSARVNRQLFNFIAIVFKYLHKIFYIAFEHFFNAVREQENC